MSRAPALRWLTVASLAVSGLPAMTDMASARSHHRHHRVVRAQSSHFVFSSPNAGRTLSAIGALDGDQLTGFPGPTTADPYERPAVGYDAEGRYLQGFIYPGY